MKIKLKILENIWIKFLKIKVIKETNKLKGILNYWHEWVNEWKDMDIWMDEWMNGLMD